MYFPILLIPDILEYRNRATYLNRVFKRLKEIQHDFVLNILHQRSLRTEFTTYLFQPLKTVDEISL